MPLLWMHVVYRCCSDYAAVAGYCLLSLSRHPHSVCLATPHFPPLSLSIILALAGQKKDFATIFNEYTDTLLSGTGHASEIDYGSGVAELVGVDRVESLWDDCERRAQEEQAIDVDEARGGPYDQRSDSAACLGAVMISLRRDARGRWG